MAKGICEKQIVKLVRPVSQGCNHVGHELFFSRNSSTLVPQVATRNTDTQPESSLRT